MIVEPDFLTHWKTLTLVAELDDDKAPLYVIALWAHAHQRKAWVFYGLTHASIKGICGYKGDAEKLFNALIRSGFLLKGKKNELILHDWDVVNATLVANWTNGKKGGRPKNPPETQGLTHGKPKPENRKPNGTERNGIELSNRIEGIEVSKLDSNLIDHVASRLSENIHWPTDADAKFLRQLSIATAAGILTETQVYEAIGAVQRAKHPPRNPVAYFTRCLKDQLSDGVTVDSIRAVKVPQEAAK